MNVIFLETRATQELNPIRKRALKVNDASLPKQTLFARSHQTLKKSADIFVSRARLLDRPSPLRKVNDSFFSSAQSHPKCAARKSPTQNLV